MKLILPLFAVAFLFAIGHGLKCYDCKLGLWDLCFTTEVECAPAEQCYSLSARAVSFVDFSMKGCLDDGCNKTHTYEFPPKSNNTLLTMETHCCTSDLCNAAPGLAGASVMALTLATITALLLTKVMV